MARFRVELTSCALLMLMVIPRLWGQSLPLSNSNAIEKLARPAGIIFSGEVVRIERERDLDGKPASIRIAFRVDEALRGCNAGETVEIAEWAELWVRGDRYRVGQKVILFLYPRNHAGLTSPVAGDLGVFMLGSSGLLQLTAQQSGLSCSQPGERPTTGESSHPTKAQAGLRNFPASKRELMNGIREAE
ncbi:MAG: hypothetical protein ACXVZX_02595 [Terriglobales bacterium]